MSLPCPRPTAKVKGSWPGSFVLQNFCVKSRFLPYPVQCTVTFWPRWGLAPLPLWTTSLVNPMAFLIVVLLALLILPKDRNPDLVATINRRVRIGFFKWYSRTRKERFCTNLAAEAHFRIHRAAEGSRPGSIVARAKQSLQIQDCDPIADLDLVPDYITLFTVYYHTISMVVRILLEQRNLEFGMFLYIVLVVSQTFWQCTSSPRFPTK